MPTSQEPMDPWPILLVADIREAKTIRDGVDRGKVEVRRVGRFHAREGAPLCIILTDGSVMGLGHVLREGRGVVEFKVDWDFATNPMKISGTWLEAFKNWPFLSKGKGTRLIPLPADWSQQVDHNWFQAVWEFGKKAEKGKVTRETRRPSAGRGKSPKKTPSYKPTHLTSAEAALSDRPDLKLDWLPPALAGLVQNRSIRSDKWEKLVLHAFRALGCQVEELGQGEAKGQSEPDLVVTHQDREGREIRLIVDAKAGMWNAPPHDFIKMSSYMGNHGGHNSCFPLFVVGVIGKGARLAARKHGAIKGQPCRIISGSDLATKVEMRLQIPDFKTHKELEGMGIE